MSVDLKVGLCFGRHGWELASCDDEKEETHKSTKKKVFKSFSCKLQLSKLIWSHAQLCCGCT